MCDDQRLYISRMVTRESPLTIWKPRVRLVEASLKLWDATTIDCTRGPHQSWHCTVVLCMRSTLSEDWTIPLFVVLGVIAVRGTAH